MCIQELLIQPMHVHPRYAVLAVVHPRYAVLAVALAVVLAYRSEIRISTCTTNRLIQTLIRRPVRDRSGVKG